MAALICKFSETPPKLRAACIDGSGNPSPRGGPEKPACGPKRPHGKEERKGAEAAVGEVLRQTRQAGMQRNRKATLPREDMQGDRAPAREGAVDRLGGGGASPVRKRAQVALGRARPGRPVGSLRALAALAQALQRVLGGVDPPVHEEAARAPLRAVRPARGRPGAGRVEVLPGRDSDGRVATPVDNLRNCRKVHKKILMVPTHSVSFISFFILDIYLKTSRYTAPTRTEISNSTPNTPCQLMLFNNNGIAPLQI